MKLVNMKDYQKNSLALSASPYLRQHAENPVWWHEFSAEVLQYAKSQNKPVLLSAGYSTCHWCHVMSADAFSHPETADFLNDHFVCIKIDREVRPDIDAWMMAYIRYESGQGGWPLNVFTSPHLNPFFAVMYAPAKEGKYGRYSFLSILKHVLNKYQNKSIAIPKWNMPDEQRGKNNDILNLPDIQKMLEQYFDYENGGLRGRQKFPPHCTLQFLLTITRNISSTDQIVRYSMQRMAMSGLHDHLQGGFFRYCTDTNWTIPHFEKMLYDQAMMLMNYSLACYQYRNDGYFDVVQSTLKCLYECFLEKGLFVSAYDADTDHKEGATYLWTTDEILTILNINEWKKFSENYILQPFEGKYHLLRRIDEPTGIIEEKLLQVRKKRKQPFRDDKIITSWNALCAIGLIFAYRYAGQNTLQDAHAVFENLFQLHLLPNGTFAHSSINEQIQPMSFLEDNASMLLLGTYLHEHDLCELNILNILHSNMLMYYKNEIWYDSFDESIGNIPAGINDHPTPSPVSLAEAASARFHAICGNSSEDITFSTPIERDYFNLAVLWRNNMLPVITSPVYINASKLPAGAIQKRGAIPLWCENRSCRELNFEHDLK